MMIDVPALSRVVLVALAWTDQANKFVAYNIPSWLTLAEGFFFFASSVAMLLGWRTRASTLVFGLTLLWVRFFEGEVMGDIAFRSHHATLLAFSILLMTLIPGGRVFSLDARSSRRDDGDLWALVLFRGLISSVYIFAVISKLEPDSLNGMRMYSQLIRLYFGSTGVPEAGFALALAITYAVIIIEVLFAVVIWSPRYSRRIFPLAAIFHLGLYLAVPVSTFSLQMISLWFLASFAAPKAKVRVLHKN